MVASVPNDQSVQKPEGSDDCKMLERYDLLLAWTVYEIFKWISTKIVLQIA